jgi:gliding motility-associated-like protein
VYRGSNDAYLTNLKISSGTLSPAFNYLTNSYTASVPNTVTSMMITPVLADLTATATVNGTVVASKTASPPIPLHAGNNTIKVVLTAQNGITVDTYIVTVNRAPSNNDNLTNLSLSSGAIAPVFASGTLSYTASVNNATSIVTVTPTVSDPDATIKVNGATVIDGSPSANILLTVGSNTINTVVTASDGVSTQTYVITIARPSNNALLTKLATVPGITLTSVSGPGFKNYTASVSNTLSSIKIQPTTSDPNATVTVNGAAVISGSASGAIALSVGATTITTVVTAQDGTTTDSYIMTITRAGSANNLDEIVSVEKPATSPRINDDGIVVHQAVSPNGDGVNDYLSIENIAGYPDNKLMIMNRNGQLVYEAKGYDNQSKVFDGHSNKNGQMQLPGTYFYSLDYTVKGVSKHKTGFFVLKY